MSMIDKLYDWLCWVGFLNSLLGLIVTTSGGAASTRNTDFRPLRGRHCLIWRDYDEAGSKYAKEVAAILGALDCTVEMIDVTVLDLSDKGDAADWLANNPDATAADVLALRREANISKTAGGLTDKTDESPFVSFVGTSEAHSEKFTDPSVGFVSDPDGHSENISLAPIPLAGTLRTIRTRLLTLAAVEATDAAHIDRLHDADLAGCLGLDVPQLAAYLSMLGESAERRAGRIPEGHTAAIHCEHCGPVWTHPAIAAVLPVLNGWPRALGCPWCFVRKAGGYIPRPPVTCESCQHFRPDTINPEAGMGICGADKGRYYPMASHRCANHRSG